jgi:hypothetical protein
MAGSSVQFNNVESVLNAYESREVCAWSLWQGKQFMFKYEGDNIGEGSQQLRATLDLLAESSNAIYTLKIYEDLPGGKIKSNTPDDGSFNFKINAESQQLTQAQYSRTVNNQVILEKLNQLEARLNEQDEDEDEPEPNRLGLIGEIIGNPTLQPIITNLITAIFSKAGTPTPTPQPPPQLQRAALNGVGDEVQLMEAIRELKKHDANLTEHLAKLAKIAAESPDSFKFLLQTLDNL